jgi:hypothetical protein
MKVWLNLFLIVPVSVMVSCREGGEKNPGAQHENAGVPRKPGSTFQDTFRVDRKSVLFFHPDSLQLEKIRNVLDPDEFSAVMHEYEFLEKNARKVLAQYFPDIPVLQSNHARYIQFRKASADSVVDLDQLGDPVGLYLFTPSRNPHLTDLPNVDRDLSAYFSGN